MKIRLTCLAIGLVLAVVVVSCTKVQDDDGIKVRTIYYAEYIAHTYGKVYRVYRFVDREYGYLCYVSSGGGIYCDKLER